MPQWKSLERSDERFKAFWEMKACRYPLPFDKGTIEKTLNIISMVQDKGVEIKGKKILDIGCGTGIYTLPLAGEARHVTGLDNSDTMIEKFRDEAMRHNISNIGILKESWGNADIRTLGLENAFDIVWCSMSMAVKDREDFKKMEDCSRKWCVYIGWGRVNKNPLVEKAYEMHGLSHGPHPGVATASAILKDLDRSPVIEYFNDFWDWEGTLEDAIEDISGHIEMQGTISDRDKLKGLLSKYEQDGIIRHRTDVEEGIIVWQVK